MVKDSLRPLVKPASNYCIVTLQVRLKLLLLSHSTISYLASLDFCALAKRKSQQDSLSATRGTTEE